MFCLARCSHAMWDTARNHILVLFSTHFFFFFFLKLQYRLFSFSFLFLATRYTMAKMMKIVTKATPIEAPMMRRSFFSSSEKFMKNPERSIENLPKMGLCKTLSRESLKLSPDCFRGRDLPRIISLSQRFDTTAVVIFHWLHGSSFFRQAAILSSGDKDSV